jgi:hypothetical protein
MSRKGARCEIARDAVIATMATVLGKLCPAAAFGTYVRAMFDRTSPEACLALVQQFSQVKEKMAWCRAAPALDTKLKSLFRCGGLEVAESAFPVQVAVG